MEVGVSERAPVEVDFSARFPVGAGVTGRLATELDASKLPADAEFLVCVAGSTTIRSAICATGSAAGGAIERSIRFCMTFA